MECSLILTNKLTKEEEKLLKHINKLLSEDEVSAVDPLVVTTTTVKKANPFDVFPQVSVHTEYCKPNFGADTFDDFKKLYTFSNSQYVLCEVGGQNEAWDEVKEKLLNTDNDAPNIQNNFQTIYNILNKVDLNASATNAYFLPLNGQLCWTTSEGIYPSMIHTIMRVLRDEYEDYYLEQAERKRQEEMLQAEMQKALDRKHLMDDLHAFWDNFVAQNGDLLAKEIKTKTAKTEIIKAIRAAAWMTENEVIHEYYHIKKYGASFRADGAFDFEIDKLIQEIKDYAKI